MTQATADKPTISRGTFVKGVAAATVTAAVSGAAAGVVQAAGHIEVPYVKKSPSGAYRTDLARAAFASLKAQHVDVNGRKWKKIKVAVTPGGK